MVAARTSFDRTGKIMERETGSPSGSEAAPEHRAVATTEAPEAAAPKPSASPCDACAANAYTEWRAGQLAPAFNAGFSFTPPKDRRLVIEFVTATVEVPAGESARLRMSTGYSSGQAANFDLALVQQGISGGTAVHVATHAIRAYTDGFLTFNINRDNATTAGHALICVSGYVV
jgi:uncharacterized protein YoaH (UPF0181 family)